MYDYFEFTIIDNANKYVELTSYSGSLSDVKIPSTVSQDSNGEWIDGNDYRVTSIGNSAFEECDSIFSVKIPQYVENIGNYAFSFCYILNTVIFIENNNLVNIGNYSFGEAYDLTNINLELCTNLKTIEQNAFFLCYGLQRIYLPASLESIGIGAFDECAIDVVVPANVTYIGVYAFSGALTLRVEDNNAVYHSSNNCIIETATKTLIAGCRNSVIPNDGSVTTIGSGAFYFASYIKSITIPSAITLIEGAPFFESYTLTEVTIESSYVYANATSATACGYILQSATTVRVLSSIDTGSNTYLNENFKKTTVENYNVYTK